VAIISGKIFAYGINMEKAVALGVNCVSRSLSVNVAVLASSA